MIDFEAELKKYEPVVEIETFEDGIAENDSKDVMELLQYLFAIADGESNVESGGENDALGLS